MTVYAEAVPAAIERMREELEVLREAEAAGWVTYAHCEQLESFANELGKQARRWMDLDDEDGDGDG